MTCKHIFSTNTWKHYDMFSSSSTFTWYPHMTSPPILGSTFFRLRWSYRPISLYKENRSVRWFLLKFRHQNHFLALPSTQALQQHKQAGDVVQKHHPEWSIWATSIARWMSLSAPTNHVHYLWDVFPVPSSCLFLSPFCFCSVFILSYWWWWRQYYHTCTHTPRQQQYTHACPMMMKVPLPHQYNNVRMRRIRTWQCNTTTAQQWCDDTDMPSLSRLMTTWPSHALLPYPYLAMRTTQWHQCTLPLPTHDEVIFTLQVAHSSSPSSCALARKWANGQTQQDQKALWMQQVMTSVIPQTCRASWPVWRQQGRST